MNYLFMPILFILALFLHNPSIRAEQLIVEFLKPYPVIANPQNVSKVADSLHKPGKSNNYHAKRVLAPSMAGVFATYAGFLDISDSLGEIAFPRKHTKPFIYLVITPKMVPIVQSGNTINHWEFNEDDPIEMYKFEQIYDEKFHLHYWSSTQEPIPTNNIIPLESMVLFVDPKYVYVPLGITPFAESPHLILPQIYIKPGFDLNSEALYILNINHYFGSVISEYKKDKDRFSRQLTY